MYIKKHPLIYLGATAAARCILPYDSVVGTPSADSALYSNMKDLDSSRFNSEMRIRHIRSCIDHEKRVTGLTVKLADNSMTHFMDLPTFGDGTGFCFGMEIGHYETIHSLMIGYDSIGLTCLAFTTNKGMTVFGEQASTPDANSKTMYFTETE